MNNKDRVYVLKTTEMKKKTIFIGAVLAILTVSIGAIGATRFIQSDINNKQEKALKAKKAEDNFKNALSKLEVETDSSNSSLVALETPKGEESVEAQKKKYQAKIQAQAKAIAKQNSDREFMSYAREVLDRMVNGGDYAIAGAWCPNSFESYLFSPRSYEILGKPLISDDKAFLDVRVKSSNKGGREITKTWDFTFNKSPDQVGRSWCLHLIS